MSVTRFTGLSGSAFPTFAFVITETALCSGAAAQEQPPEALPLNPVVVTATRLPTPENEIGSSVTVDHGLLVFKLAHDMRSGPYALTYSFTLANRRVTHRRNVWVG